MKDYFLVKITSFDMPTAWYASLISSYFECYEWCNDYVLKEDYDSGDQNPWRHIVKYDCIVVNSYIIATCPDCDGRGGYNNAGGATSCNTCEGTGKVRAL